MSNSDNTRGGRQGQPATPGYPPQQPGRPQYPQQTHPQHGYAQPSQMPAPGYDPRYAAAPGYPPQAYPQDAAPVYQGYASQQPPSPQAGAYAGQPASADYGVPPVAGFAPPSDDYYYPQGQNILPEVPPAAMPPELSGGAGLGGDIPYIPNAHVRGHEAPAYAAYQGGYPPHAPAAGMEYGESAPEHGAVEQISQRLAQLQSQYDQEMASANWQAAQHNYQPDQGHEAYGYAGQQEPALDYQQAYHQPYAQPETPGYAPAGAPAGGYRQPAMRAEAPAYQPPASQAPHYQEAAAYQAEAGRGYAEPMPQARASAHDPRDGYQQEGHAPYAAGTMVAQQAVESSGRGKLMLAGAFAVALALGGGAAYTFKYADMFGGRGGDAAAPVVKATGEPVKVASEAQPGMTASQNRALHERLSGAGAAADGERVAPQTRASGSPAAAVTGMLPPSAQAQDGADAGGPRRVKTLIVRPDGSILQPGDGDGEIAAPADDEGRAKAQEAAAELADGARSAVAAPAAKPEPVVQPEPVAAPPRAAKPQPAKEKAAPKPVEAVPAPRAEPAPKAAAKPVEKKIAAVEAPATDAAGGDVGEPYLVQVTSRNSPSDALAAFADMQQKYGSLLGTYEPDIERADLGDKGVWYRLRVGPVAGKTAAADLCIKLKAAGHPGCIVRRK